MHNYLQHDRTSAGAMDGVSSVSRRQLRSTSNLLVGLNKDTQSSSGGSWANLRFLGMNNLHHHGEETADRSSQPANGWKPLFHLFGGRTGKNWDLEDQEQQSSSDDIQGVEQRSQSTPVLGP